jgi:hypothetical protein
LRLIKNVISAACDKISMSVVNYSKWDHIEISDDEDDTHPNVDTPSLFKWRHEARLEREKAQEQEKAKRKLEAEMFDNNVLRNDNIWQAMPSLTMLIIYNDYKMMDMMMH